MRILPPQKYLPTVKGLTYNIAACGGEAVFPLYASFKLTARCHFGCPFCNVKKDMTPDLPTDAVKAVLDNLSRSSVLMTSFEGGEPLLRDDIGELLRYARKRCGFYLLFTTSVKDLESYPLEEYGRYIDFFHISIDEGHNNLSLYDALPRLVERIESQVSVQVVVTRDTMGSLEAKVARCHDAGANIVIIPATHMDNTGDFFPDIGELERAVSRIRKKYPLTIHTPQGYFTAYRRARCSSASIIIAPDGRLYYPCHIRGTKGPDLATADLSAWLTTREAKLFRVEMKQCTRNCGWYQYYAIGSYMSLFSSLRTLGPMLFQKKRKTAGDTEN
jgi:MoaA/NifB/PqqE/SkfB family radical SAM enzyme